MSTLDTTEETLLEKRSRLARQLANLNNKAHQLKASYQSIVEQKKTVQVQIQNLAKEEALLQKRKKELQKVVKEVNDNQKSFVQKKQLLQMQQTQVVQAIAKVDHVIKSEQEAQKKREQERLIEQQEQEAKKKQQQEEHDGLTETTATHDSEDIDFDLDTFLTDDSAPTTPADAEKQSASEQADNGINNQPELDQGDQEHETEEIEIDIDDTQLDVDLSGLTDEEQFVNFDIDINEDMPSSRVASRTAINVDVNLHTESNFFTGLTENLSEGGLFVATYDLLDVGTQVDLVINLPNQHPIKTQCIVCWTRELNILNSDLCPGMGLQFQNLGESQKLQIREFLDLRDPMLFDKP